MRDRSRRMFLAAIATTLGVAFGISTAHADSLPMLHAQDTHLADPSGHNVVLKGCNLGNYLMLEGWMFGGTIHKDGNGFHDGATVYRTLHQRFGDEKAEHLIETYRTNWITPRDFDAIKSFGFNVVRLPFDYRLIQEEKRPFATKPNAFRWLDHAVKLAQDAGIYVILDLHGVPGGQSNEDHTGEAGQDHLWNSKEDQQRTVDVWRILSEHFKDNSTVAAYDLINEPYGNHTEDCRPVLAKIMPQIYEAVRGNGDQHVVYFSGALNGGIGFYGNPHDKGMTNVAFTEHYYPGLFGSKPAMETQARELNQGLPAKQAYMTKIASPYFVGEFNVVVAAEDPARMLRAYFDRFAQYGWAGTMWSYKLISADGGAHADSWYAVTNAEPLPKLDLDTASYDELETFFQKLGTMPLAANEQLKESLTTAKPAPLYLAKYPQLPTAAPVGEQASELPGYTSADIGSATNGFTQAQTDGSVTILGGGTDIFGGSDSFRFVSKPANGSDAEVSATITSFLDSAEYAKTGVMARWGALGKADAAMAMANLFPDGTLALVTRSAAGEGAKEIKVAAGVHLPVELRLRISNGEVTAEYRTTPDDWLTIGTAKAPSQGDLRTGLAVCSHVDAVLTAVKASLDDKADAALDAASRAHVNADVTKTSLLKNGTFKQTGSPAAEWNTWGNAINRATPTSLTFDLSAPGPSGLWQEVQAVAGRRYSFVVDVKASKDQTSGNIELRMESTTRNGQVTLNSQAIDISKLTRDAVSHLSVSGTAASDRVRVLLVSDKGTGGFTVEQAKLVLGNDGK